MAEKIKRIPIKTKSSKRTVEDFDQWILMYSEFERNGSNDSSHPSGYLSISSVLQNIILNSKSAN